MLECEEKPLNRNFITILKLELFCQRSGKWDEIPDVQAFMKLHSTDSAKAGSKLMVQGKQKVQACEDSKTLEEKVDDEVTSINLMNLFNPNLFGSQPPATIYPLLLIHPPLPAEGTPLGRKQLLRTCTHQAMTRVQEMVSLL